LAGMDLLGAGLGEKRRRGVRKPAIIFLGLLSLVMTLTACGISLGGSETLDMDGSSTVFPITEAVVEEYGKFLGGSARITVGISGTGGGFQKFCNGETDISSASRPIKAVEVERCAKAGVEFIELPIAVDGLTVVVNSENDFLQCVTVEDLHLMWGPESEEIINRWNQVRDQWPDEPLLLFGPGADSGTFDYFTKVINGEAQASRGDFIASERDDVLVQGISGEKNSLGYFGFSFFEENQDILRGVAIDGGSGCIAPTRETINNDTYNPLSRPLFIYVSKESAQDADVDQFVRFHLGEVSQQLVAEVGYVEYPAEVYDMILARFENGITGTIFGGSDPKEGSVAEVLSSNQ
jgi:phosphate transport system substrate-binding protein